MLCFCDTYCKKQYLAPIKIDFVCTYLVCTVHCMSTFREHQWYYYLIIFWVNIFTDLNAKMEIRSIKIKKNFTNHFFFNSFLVTEILNEYVFSPFLLPSNFFIYFLPFFFFFNLHTNLIFHPYISHRLVNLPTILPEFYFLFYFTFCLLIDLFDGWILRQIVGYS